MIRNKTNFEHSLVAQRRKGAGTARALLSNYPLSSTYPRIV
jgi:hypothetical protein